MFPVPDRGWSVPSPRRASPEGVLCKPGAKPTSRPIDEIALDEFDNPDNWPLTTQRTLGNQIRVVRISDHRKLRWLRKIDIPGTLS